jgi:hypothetical protein
MFIYFFPWTLAIGYWLLDILFSFPSSFAFPCSILDIISLFAFFHGHSWGLFATPKSGTAKEGPLGAMMVFTARHNNNNLFPAHSSVLLFILSFFLLQ